ncbi:MAG: 30S ribosomal protein S3 [Candidatus Diapherotrites archaeon]|nr:30S ribosomal protein S3 [Candidatus Diapherotrites archaeon]
MIEKFFVDQGVKRVELEEYLAKEMENAGFTKSQIVKTPLVTRIIVNVTKPGLAIGKSGATIRGITETIAKRFGIENPQLEIKEIPIPELDATAMVNKIKALIEKGFSWRSVAYRTVKDIEARKPQGIELLLSGKLTGKGGRKRRARIAVGYMKKVGDQVKLVDFAKATAYPKPGAIGIKIRIVKPDTVFPDKISIAEVLRQRKQALEKKTSQAMQAGEAQKQDESIKEATAGEAVIEIEQHAVQKELPQAKQKEPTKTLGQKKKENEETEKK